MFLRHLEFHADKVRFEIAGGGVCSLFIGGKVRRLTELTLKHRAKREEKFLDGYKFAGEQCFYSI